MNVASRMSCADTSMSPSSDTIRRVESPPAPAAVAKRRVLIVEDEAPYGSVHPETLTLYRQLSRSARVAS